MSVHAGLIDPSNSHMLPPQAAPTLPAAPPCCTQIMKLINDMPAEAICQSVGLCSLAGR